MFKVNNSNIRARCAICSKLTIKTPERNHWRHSYVSIVNFQQVNAGWVIAFLINVLLHFNSFRYPKDVTIFAKKLHLRCLTGF